MTARAPTLLIFDCDGVLVDSEPVSNRVLAETMRDLGLDLTEAECYRLFLGRSFASLKTTLQETFARSLSDAQELAMRERLNELYKLELQPIEGIIAALGQIDIPHCVASSSQPERIRFSLELTGLSGYFGKDVYSATMVKRGKPAPDLFLHAAREMGHAPQDCLVIEDSPAGIEAAHSAGMRAFAFVGGSHAAAAGLAASVATRQPQCIFERMDELPQLIANLSRS